VGLDRYVACLRGQRLYRLGLDGKGVEALLVGRYGRLRTVAPVRDGSPWLLTTNRDGLSPGEIAALIASLASVGPHVSATARSALDHLVEALRATEAPR
jgi:hypothetical protein